MYLYGIHNSRCYFQIIHQDCLLHLQPFWLPANQSQQLEGHPPTTLVDSKYLPLDSLKWLESSGTIQLMLMSNDSLHALAALRQFQIHPSMTNSHKLWAPYVEVE